MAQDLNTLLKRLEALNRAAKEPGKLTREQLDAQVKEITLGVKEALLELGKSLPPELAGASGMLVEVFKTQLGAIFQQSGMGEQSEEMKKLSDELELIKRSYIRS
ncbi:hypothetical protein [Hyalangium sp.]|uniref:hypothetical protein n=1 Tax=Hyalangium sp. TaxID=2028555 RepID=UPI002D70C229|nr:hypothetical protein [Hyalangium sp.]HYI00199.1 hypothetical protein [Hyalangium sp.]